MNGKKKDHATARTLLFLGTAALAFTLCADWLNSTWGPVTFLCLTAMAASLVVAARETHRLAARAARRTTPAGAYSSALLLVMTLGVTTALLELGLQVALEVRPAGGKSDLVMPDEWARRPAQIEGSRHSYWWHGKLHVHDDNGMRRSQPFPPRRENTCRIAVFGDSLTYGYGVAAEEAYPALIESMLAEAYRVEVLNLGVIGWQSADIAAAAERFIPGLEPDLALYGVCLNDFLDSGEGQQSNRRRRGWGFPLPYWFKMTMTARTRLAELLVERYDRLLMLLGLRMDFHDDILKDFDGYQARFGRDVRRLNDIVRAGGLPPVTAMVLYQLPDTAGPAVAITAVAERLMAQAGIDVIPTRTYYEDHRGRVLHVSPWEGHPGVEAHRIFAGEFTRRLTGHPALESCRIE